MMKPWKEGPVLADRLTSSRKHFDERGVSPVIAVILMVAITVVLAAVLYTMVTVLITQPDPPIYGAIIFEEDETTPGKYIGTYEGSIGLKDIGIRVYDASKEQTIILYPASETSKEVPGGINLSYNDVNENIELDAADLLIIKGGETGDKVTIVDQSSGKTVATHTLN